MFDSHLHHLSILLKISAYILSNCKPSKYDWQFWEWVKIEMKKYPTFCHHDASSCERNWNNFPQNTNKSYRNNTISIRSHRVLRNNITYSSLHLDTIFGWASLRVCNGSIQNQKLVTNAQHIICNFQHMPRETTIHMLMVYVLQY